MPLTETIQILGNLGEFVGAIGVVATLAYLAVQIRQNTKSTRASTYSDATLGWQDYMHDQSVEDLELLVMLSGNHKELSHPQFLRTYYLYRMMFRRLEHDFNQRREGTFDEQTWAAYLSAFIQDVLANAAGRAMWKLQRDYFDPTFSDFLDSTLTQASQLPTHPRQRFTELMEQESQQPA
jgi:hypothetical protein